MGGLIVEQTMIPRVALVWQDIKERLCGEKDVELKWSHFFAGPHQDRITNPLKSSSPNEWRRQVLWALEALFVNASLVPITTVVRKDKAANAMFIDIREDGIGILDINTLWLGVIAQFAMFLEHKKAYGEIWLDQLGSRKEEARRQSDWHRLRDEEGVVDVSYQRSLRRILPTLKFFDSEAEPMIQVADFVSGVLWAAAEGDEEFLLSFFKEYFPWGRDTYTFMYMV